MKRLFFRLKANNKSSKNKQVYEYIVLFAFLFLYYFIPVFIKLITESELRKKTTDIGYT